MLEKGQVKFNLTRISENLRDDKQIVLKFVEKNGEYLGQASERLRDDKDVVIAAVKSNLFSLICASERLQKDDEIAAISRKHHGGLALRDFKNKSVKYH